MRKIAQLLAAGVVAAAIPMSAQAVVTVTSQDYGFTTYPAGTSQVIDFDAALPAGVTLTGSGYVLQTGSNASGAAPATSGPPPAPVTYDTTRYLSVFGGTASLNLASLYQSFSLYWGSIDTYNEIRLFNGATLVGTINNTTAGVLSTGSGNQVDPVTNRRVNINSTLNFNRIDFLSSPAAFEIDNVSLGTAVPEAATWMMMLAGFGMMGYAMRRRPRTAVTFG